MELSVETFQKRVARLQELLPAVLYLWFLLPLAPGENKKKDISFYLLRVYPDLEVLIYEPEMPLSRCRKF